MVNIPKMASLRNIRVIVILALVVVFLVTVSYEVMSDTSVHGLTVKTFYVSRYCTSSPAAQGGIVTFFVVASVWSSSSLHTSISQVSFSLSADGLKVGSLNETNASWDPGTGTSYQLTFANAGLSPFSLPATSNLVLSLTAQVSAGLSNAQITTSDSSTQNFGNTSC
jgi:hypothetical protein